MLEFRLVTYCSSRLKVMIIKTVVSALFINLLCKSNCWFIRKKKWKEWLIDISLSLSFPHLSCSLSLSLALLFPLPALFLSLSLAFYRFTDLQIFFSYISNTLFDMHILYILSQNWLWNNKSFDLGRTIL